MIEHEAKSILLKHKRLDSWFISCYGMNLYRGCAHGCAYCDGRAESYRVEGDFGRDIQVKVNAPKLLARELDPARKRKPMRKCWLMIGGGVSDSYQPLEKKYQLTRSVLEVIESYSLPVHVLTKSLLVERDINILTKINQKSRAVVSMSFSSLDNKLSSIFEPGVPPPTERLTLLKKFKAAGLACGMFLMPVIPFLSDTPSLLDETLAGAAAAGLDFVIFSGMTLKEGRQQEYFYRSLKENYPGLPKQYRAIYRGDRWGQADAGYYRELHSLFHELSRKHGLKRRIPARLFQDLLTENDLVTVILEQLDYLLMLEGKQSPYRYAARSIARLETPLSEMKAGLRKLSGVGAVTEKLILEILERGTSAYYEGLL